MSALPTAIEVFYSYADADEDLRSELEKHLSLLQREGLIAPWHRRLITPGMDWTEALDRHLATASVILLLVSSDFVASDYCYGTEMQKAMERHNAGETHVIPILLRRADWESAPFGKLNALPSNRRPVTSWSNRDEAFADIVQGIRAILGYGQRRPAPFMAEDLPTNFVQRTQEYELLVRCLLDEKRKEPVALRGAGGCGKTTLACALCHDKRVWEAFDGILWVTFGKQPGHLVNKIEELIYILNREKPGYTSLDAATTRLDELLADRHLLLVLDDVWNSAHLKPFLQGGKRCTRLITTRDERVIPASVPLGLRIQVDAMQQDEAIQLLISGIQGFEERTYLAQHHPELKRLATRLGEWPLLLMLASSMLQERINLHMQDVAYAITAVHHALDKRGVTAFDLSNAIERSQAVAKTIEVSLELLQPDTRVRYQELVIFPEDVNIPLRALQHLWGRTGNLDEFDTEELCIRLRSLSLLLHYNADTQTVRLHDVMRNYLQYQWTKAELIQLHADFLNTYRVARWADLPQHESYLWDHLAIHLIAAGRTSELITTVMDGAYLASKASYRPVSLLEQDLELAIAQESDYPILRLLKYSVANMTHLLNACHTWQECAGVLHSRLLHLPEFESLLSQSLEHLLTRPYLTPWHPLPDLPMNALKRTLTGHTDRVTNCAISPDGSWFLSASDDGTLKIWDTASGQLRQTLTGYNGKACAISPDGSWLLYYRAIGAIEIWKAASGQFHHTFTIRGTAYTVSPDGSWLLSASDDGTLKIWDTASGQLRQTLLAGHTKKVRVCAISPDGSWLLSASDDGTLTIWDAASGQLRRTLLAEHTKEVRACAISPDGSWFLSVYLSASDEGILKIWDTASGQLRQTLTVWGAGYAISPDGSWFLSASKDGTPRIWDAASGQLRQTLTGHTDAVMDFAISPDGSWFLSASVDQTLRIWDAASGQCRNIFSGHASVVRACAISPDGSWFLSASHDGTLKIWDAASGQPLHTLTGHTKRVNACASALDGKHLLSASDDRTLKIWDTASGQCLRTLTGSTLTGHLDAWTPCAISPDGSWLLSASRGGILKIWDVASGVPYRTLSGHTQEVTACAISPNGSWFLSASFGAMLKIWDTVSGKLRYSIPSGHKGPLTACAVSPDSSWLLSASFDQTLRIWDATSGKLRHTLIGHTDVVTACAISPDSSWLLSASFDQTLRVWDAISGKLRHTLTGHADVVTACAISPDSSWLLSVSKDGALKIWDVATKMCRATLRVDGNLQCCLFCGDKYHIVAGGGRGVYFLRVVDE